MINFMMIVFYEMEKIMLFSNEFFVFSMRLFRIGGRELEVVGMSRWCLMIR